MKKNQKVFITIAIILIVVGTFLTIVGGVISAGEIGSYIDRRREESVSWDNAEWEGYYDSQEGVDSIDVEIRYGEVKIIKGDSFQIKCSDVKANSIESYKEGSTWVIEDKNKRNFWSSKLFKGAFWQHNAPMFEITIPKDFEAKDVELVLDAGTLDVEGIVGGEVSIEVGAGKCSIDNVTARESFEAEVGAGELEIYGMDVVNARMDCGAGRIYAEGKIIGESKMDCGLGEIKMSLTGNPDAYNYKVDCGLGQVLINGSSYNVSPSVNHNNMAEDSFNINCGLGQVSLNIEERGDA